MTELSEQGGGRVLEDEFSEEVSNLGISIHLQPQNSQISLLFFFNH